MVRAITILPGQANSARLDEIPDPASHDGQLLVRMVALGICGTDHEIVAGLYGSAPFGHERLVLGHESLGRVEAAPSGSGFAEGDLVVGIVRRPDSRPCPNCAAGEWDMCRTGDYTERGIKQRDGYAAERVLLEPNFAIRVDPALGLLGVLVEPASVLAKAWEHVERIGRRAVWSPRTVLITGGGPIGLLAALIGRQRGMEVTVLDHNSQGPKPGLIGDAGARHALVPGQLARSYDVIIECTGVPSLIADALERLAPDGILCLTGVSSSRSISLDLGSVNRHVVLGNQVAFGSVNANRRHYEAAAAALARADRPWLERLITRRVPLDRWHEALEKREDDVKTIIEFS